MMALPPAFMRGGDQAKRGRGEYMKHNKDNEKYAQSLRKEMTPWERKLWYLFLKDYPIRFQRQKCIDNFIVDFYCYKAKIVIELDGGGHYEPEAEQYDQKRTEVLKDYGLKVLQFCTRHLPIRPAVRTGARTESLGLSHSLSRLTHFVHNWLPPGSSNILGNGPPEGLCTSPSFCLEPFLPAFFIQMSPCKA